MNKIENNSLKKRYLYKITTNLVGLGINFFTQTIIPRGLGPRSYGDFIFLTNFFNQLVGFFDMGTSIGFYTKISQRQREFGLVSFYMYFAIAVSMIIMVFTVLTVSTSIHVSLWPDQGIFYIFLAAIWGILTWFASILNKMGDAYGLTISAEMARISQRILGFVLIIFLFFFKQLTLKNFFFIIT